MLKTLTVTLAAAAMLVAQTVPSLAFDGRRARVWQTDPLIESLRGSELKAGAYFRVPFARRASAPKYSYGLSLSARTPEAISYSGPAEYRSGPSLLDLSFGPAGFADFRVSGMGVRETQRRLNALGDPETSLWWTLGLMAVAVGVAAMVIVLSEGDADINAGDGT